MKPLVEADMFTDPEGVEHPVVPSDPFRVEIIFGLHPGVSPLAIFCFPFGEIYGYSLILFREIDGYFFPFPFPLKSPGFRRR